MHPRNVGTLLKSSIDPLMPQAKRLLELRQILHDALPANLAKASTIANYKQGKVVIFAENSAVAAKLRLLAPGVKDRMAQSGLEITGIEVEVQLKARAVAPASTDRRLSAAAAKEISELAAQLADSKLKFALESLASKASKD